MLESASASDYPNLLALSRQVALLLGSSSPRRSALLGELGLSFAQVSPDVDESPRSDEAPRAYALRLAEEKALVAIQLRPDCDMSIGCDTIVVHDNEILPKPRSTEHAIEMLSRLSGSSHNVTTAVALAARDGTVMSTCDTTSVTFNHLRQTEIKKYVASGEPMDKAGAYGIQGMGGFLVDSYRGDVDTVVGLPRRCLDDLARRFLDRRSTSSW